MRRRIARPWTFALGIALLLAVGVSAWQGDTLLWSSLGVVLGVGLVLVSFIPKETP